jgi:hypothetical protein
MTYAGARLSSLGLCFVVQRKRPAPPVPVVGANRIAFLPI